MFGILKGNFKMLQTKTRIFCCLLSALAVLSCSCKRNIQGAHGTNGQDSTSDDAQTSEEYDIYEVTGDTVSGQTGIEYSYVIKSDVVEYHDIVVFSYNLKYPTFEGENEDIASKLDAYSSGKAEQFVSTLKNLAEEIYLNLGDDEISSFISYNASLEITVETFSDLIVSMKLYQSLYIGGLHDIVDENGATFSVLDGTLKSVSDFIDEDYAADRIISEVKSFDVADMLFDGFEDALRQLVKEDDLFYIADGCLNVICPQYYIGPYSMGIPIFTIPLE